MGYYDNPDSPPAPIMPESREQRLARLRADRRPEPRLTPPAPTPQGSEEAKYAGTCRLCSQPIDVGDNIAFLGGRPVHGEHR